MRQPARLLAVAVRAWFDARGESHWEGSVTELLREVGLVDWSPQRAAKVLGLEEWAASLRAVGIALARPPHRSAPRVALTRSVV